MVHICAHICMCGRCLHAQLNEGVHTHTRVCVAVYSFMFKTPSAIAWQVSLSKSPAAWGFQEL